jgi:hypothetical protein
MADDPKTPAAPPPGEPPEHLRRFFLDDPAAIRIDGMSVEDYLKSRKPAGPADPPTAG